MRARIMVLSIFFMFGEWKQPTGADSHLICYHIIDGLSISQLHITLTYFMLLGDVGDTKCAMLGVQYGLSSGLILGVLPKSRPVGFQSPLVLSSTLGVCTDICSFSVPRKFMLKLPVCCICHWQVRIATKNFLYLLSSGASHINLFVTC